MLKYYVNDTYMRLLGMYFLLLMPHFCIYHFIYYIYIQNY